MPDPFIDYLQSIGDNRALLAELRRGLGRDAPLGVYRHVARFLGEGTTPWRERALLIVAPLFALHPTVGTTKLPTALAAVARARDSGSIETRFVALLECEREELPVHLRHVVTLVHGDAPTIGLDWGDLLKSVQAWSHPDRYAQRRWARHYWSPAAKAADATEGESTS